MAYMNIVNFLVARLKGVKQKSEINSNNILYLNIFEMLQFQHVIKIKNFTVILCTLFLVLFSKCSAYFTFTA